MRLNELRQALQCAISNRDAGLIEELRMEIEEYHEKSDLAA